MDIVRCYPLRGYNTEMNGPNPIYNLLFCIDVIINIHNKTSVLRHHKVQHDFEVDGSLDMSGYISHQMRNLSCKS